MSTFLRASLKARFFLMLMSLFLAAPSFASSVRQMDFSEVVAGAELIFEGRVTEHQVSEEKGLVYTYVDFEIIEVLKGGQDKASLRLRFLGGSKNGNQVMVTDNVIPEPGETGFYFVESATRNLVNPLLGWSQGHYLIVDDGSGKRVVTNQKAALGSGLPSKDKAAQKKGIESSLSPAAARGIRGKSGKGSDDGLTAEGFRHQVLDLLAGGGHE